MVTIRVEKADLKVCPQQKPLSFSANTSITHGDQHAHTINMIHRLVSSGVISCSEATYKELRRLHDSHYVDFVEEEQIAAYLGRYKNLINYTKNSRDTLVDIYSMVHPQAIVSYEEMRKFESLLDTITVNNTKTLTRFIGDTLADRGACDYFTLMLYLRLIEMKINYEILLSNHDLDFIFWMEQELPTISHTHTKSLLSLEASVKNLFRQQKNEILRKIKKSYEEAYLPRLKLFSYEVEYSASGKPRLIIYTHAPVAWDTIEAAAKKLLGEKECNFDTLEDTIATLDKMSVAFEKKAKARQITSLINRESLEAFLSSGDHLKYPFENMIWNRTLSHENLKSNEEKPFDLAFVYGHTGEEGVKMPENYVGNTKYYCTDSNFAKSSFNTEGMQCIAIGQQLDPQLKPPISPLSQKKATMQQLLSDYPNKNSLIRGFASSLMLDK